MTPILLLLFRLRPSTAIYSDLVATFPMRLIGAATHLRRGRVSIPLVTWTSVGSVPAAFTGALVLHLLGNGRSAADISEHLLGGALLAGAGLLAVRAVRSRHSCEEPGAHLRDLRVRPLATAAIGALGGLLVGLTSVGAGSIMMVLFACTYPSLSTGSLVGTDLAQAIPLGAAAALGALAFGHLDPVVTGSVLTGGLPGALAGSLLSSRVPDRFVRPAVTLAILASGLRYAGVGTGALGWLLASVLVGGACWMAWRVAGKRSTPDERARDGTVARRAAEPTTAASGPDTGRDRSRPGPARTRTSPARRKPTASAPVPLHDP